ncbi:MAG: dephospho-CoA kinase [Chitinophagales bacterium]|nr:MAG: dephospho-CoA kinase [Chitinophagales bacterium]
MLKTGVTGGIGSGKTTVCKIFELLGVPVYYADQRAKELMQEDKHLAEAIRQLMGPEAYVEGKLNRQFIAEKVFNNKPLLAKLNALVHPVVTRDVKQWMEHLEQVPYAIEESAILFESGSHRILDTIIVVYAPQAERIRRVQARDQLTYEQVIARMRNQMPDEEKVKMADFVIYNDMRHSLIKQVLAIHHILLSMSREEFKGSAPSPTEG